MQSLAAGVPELVGGSGDLDASTFTWLKGYGDLEPPSRPPQGVQGAAGGTWSYAGRNIHFGVREHARLAVEAASRFGWERWTGERGDVVGVPRFGASAPGRKVLEEYGLTADNVARRALALVSGARANG
ncbi:transketolase-like TK C-terminal-containing protein [Sorangium sp. So ce388]|uniref:transketolase-like TK C-terminal-containing protein n=1 Tax=Sorangium sp. So ce388 TaxID=3133309 RepID=UPI003F5AE7C6